MLTKRTEWEGEEFRLVRLEGLAQNTAYPRGNDGLTFYTANARRMHHLYVWSTGGKRGHGTAAAEAWAKYCVEDGRAAQPHTFFIPSTLEAVDGKFELYRLWDDDMITHHTPRASMDSVSVCLAGRFASRWSIDPGHDPDPEQLEGLDALVNDYLVPRYGLDVRDVRGGFDAGFPTEPGDALEHWVRTMRGETWGVPPTDAEQDTRPLRTPEQRARALREMGCDVGPCTMGQRMALERFQRRIPWLQVTGRWDAPTIRAARIELAVSRTTD